MKTTEQNDVTTIAKSPSDFWTQQIQHWQQSGASQSAYCRDHKLSYHRFTYWRRKLAPSAARDRLKRPGVSSGFAPVEPLSAVPSSGLTATLPNGVLLQGITLDNLDTVKPLLGLPS